MFCLGGMTCFWTKQDVRGQDSTWILTKYNGKMKNEVDVNLHAIVEDQWEYIMGGGKWGYFRNQWIECRMVGDQIWSFSP